MIRAAVRMAPTVKIVEFIVGAPPAKAKTNVPIPANDARRRPMPSHVEVFSSEEWGAARETGW